jgi:hypothetical protein
MKHGDFEYVDGTITGPKAYMEQRFPQFRAEVRDGKSEAMIACSYAPAGTDSATLMLQALQLDYANWHGITRLLAGLQCTEDEPQYDKSEPTELEVAQVDIVVEDSTGRRREPKSGWLVPVSGFEDCALVLVYDAGQWSVHEQRTGLAIAFGATYQIAIRDTRKRLWQKGVARFHEAVNACLAEAVA